MADVFAVLADPNRRQMLETLREGDHAVNELVNEVDIAQSGVSRHLRILREAGLVDVRRDAQRRIYSLRTEPLEELDDWLGHYRDLWDARFDKLESHIEQRKQDQDVEE